MKPSYFKTPRSMEECTWNPGFDPIEKLPEDDYAWVMNLVILILASVFLGMSCGVLWALWVMP